jgi:predicted RNase H-like nuclease
MVLFMQPLEGLRPRFNVLRFPEREGVDQMEVTIIGVDCATKENYVGLALGRVKAGETWIEEVTLGSRVLPVAETIAGWAGRSRCTLLALDAPLGWPADLGGALVAHTAGNPIDIDPNLLFRRETDRFVKREINKQPLDVGADRIARTARAALELLQDVRNATDEAIPLAWDPDLGAGIHAIEVYPGATMAAYGVAARGYKKRKEGQAPRRELLAFLGEQVRLPEDTALMEENADALDAGLCVLSALDFLRGRATTPRDQQKARKEGWIWVRKPVE